MMTSTSTSQSGSSGREVGAALISADSHVIEPVEIWDGLLPAGFWSDESATFSQRPGGYDPDARIGEMGVDGVVAEVLYPSLALRLFGLDARDVQERCFRRYNEWLTEFCAHAPERLLGIGLVPAYDIERAVAEVEWCHERGLRGVQVWQTPHPDLPFSGSHYDPLWDVCSSLSMPVSLHILTGHDYSKTVFEQGQDLVSTGLPMYRLSVNLKLLAVMDALVDLVFSGALDRFPTLQLVLVENEVAWLPFVIDQFEYYYRRYEGRNPAPLTRPPSEVFAAQIHATFFRDPNVSLVVDRFGGDNLMWSNDYPHGNSTWPNSRDVVHTSLGHLDRSTLEGILLTNAAELYRIDRDALTSTQGEGR